jgi:hypothetical protein
MAVAALLGSQARGGVLASDSSAMLKGTKAFNGAFAQMKASVDYAVYMPGQFGASAALGSPAAYDPSGDSEYVYTFQVFNSGASITGLSVGLDAIVGLISGGANPTNIGFAPYAGGQALNLTDTAFIPNDGTTVPKTSVRFAWDQTTFSNGEHSDILLFTSPYGPQFKNAGMTTAPVDFAAGVQLPSPLYVHTPEPSTLILAAVAATGILAAGYRRRRKV